MWVITKWRKGRNLKKMIEVGRKLQELEDNGARPSDKEYNKVAIEYLERSLKERKYNARKL